ncbi:Daunorubicin/doxorubicin resistance ATP-binding protein DrrA [Microbacterium lemovicicum]|uniref:Daunorubicin/doxorubicin resistance ATP-binding protein DrrA n=1 Tax=Microbacterium lemovicicum TaxID=1072463 RepID=A0A3Q9IWA9_9MICO|nr:ABC transporter ATP-binding protein [Microbacterium lemovicicum]AZS35799.1 Daunorubicin/doxorubicin resistance ATP-binding protein DrrA [Microbacterium lemovicicum]
MTTADTAGSSDDGLAVQTVGLTKRFGAQTAVDGIDLAVPRGSVFGFLGPNGSGKTTTIRMLLGLLRSTSGEARVLGEDMPAALDAVLPRVGALVEGPAFAPFLTGEQNLRRFDAADRHSAPRTRDARVAAALERVGLTHAAKKKAHAYSLGMKQRLGLANALLMPRELLVLDEPTNGLDPQGTREVRALIRSFAADGTTVFVSSHLLAEIEQLCSHVGVMSGGRLVAQGTLDDFRGAGALPRVRVRTPDVDATRAVLSERGVTTDAGDAASDLDVVTGVLAADTVAEDLVAALVERGVRVRGFELLGQSLEQRFVQLTGEGFDVVA